MCGCTSMLDPLTDNFISVLIVLIPVHPSEESCIGPVGLK